VLIAKWISPAERGRFVSFIYTGMPLGSAATLIISGYIAHYMGWASVFYVTGVVTIIWAGLWFWLVYETPSVHPTISDEEYNYIEANLADQRDDNNGKLKTPWREIFRSVPMWGILICHPASTWGHYTCLILTPTYLKTALHFDLTSVRNLNNVNLIATKSIYFKMSRIVGSPLVHTLRAGWRPW